MKTLVVYYSKTGSNRYLAQKTAAALQADLEAVRPRLNLFFFLFLFSLMKTGLGINRFRKNVENYDRIVLCGPIWMGQLISPLRDFIKKYGKNIRQLYFVCCCAGGEDTKDDKFGYNTVFREVKRLMGDKCVHCEAFPTTMVLPEDKKTDGTAGMNARLSDSNFTGEIEKRFEDFIQKITG